MLILEKRKNKYKKIILIVVFFIIILLSIFIYILNILFFKDYLSEKVKLYNKQIKINKGQSLNKTIDNLCNYLNYNKLQCIGVKLDVISKYKNIKHGFYIFSGSYKIGEIFQKFTKGPDINYNVFTILPSETKRDIAYKIKQKYNKLFSGNLADKISNKFLNLMNNVQYINKQKDEFTFLKYFGNIESLEGFLYPDSYWFKPNDYGSLFFPNLLIQTALKNFENKAYPLFDECKNKSNCNPYNLTNYEILILASIVEKEEFNANNMPYVADILIRRYKNGWFIGADWTLCYGLKVLSNKCKNYLYNKYLVDKNNLYNTRVNKGLPPTPVGNPTKNAIKSVLYPQKNSYWYYLHGCDGKIYFGKNAVEHQYNKKNLCK